MDAYLGYYSVVPDLEKNKRKCSFKVADGRAECMIFVTALYATQYLLNHADIPKERATVLAFPPGIPYLKMKMNWLSLLRR